MQTARAIRSNPLAPLFRALLVCALAATPVFSQSQLPRNFPAKQQLSTAEKSTLATFFEDWTELLTSEDPEESADATQALTAPFDEDTISVAFRLECSNAIAQTLDKLIADDDSRVAFVAASLAGKIATTRTARVLKTALEDSRPAVRYAAAVGYRDLLEPVFADEPLAIGANQIPAIFNIIEQAIETEEDPHVAGGLITTFSAAAAANNINAADQALTALARATAKLAARLRANPPIDNTQSWDRALYRAIKLAYDVSLQQQIDRGEISNEFARQSAIAAALTLAYVQQRIESADLADTESTSALVSLADVAERALVMVNEQINTGAPIASTSKAKDAARKAIDNDDPFIFSDAIDDYMTIIKRSPYSVPADQLP